ncbi:IclR family transcriptional regulator [Paenibacillus sp. Soil787]|uniref:IclR family transcriptional regulator n=1 Tax=Paenibacillus sp. Soil787 TaxID=1736411 RepID=UPI0006F33B14|nr:IclR family transcriptional regulator [Paenibacillus sp. Soil787]KRF42183.1 transcriptional regulator [Paenibacillus sp. Soil787]
MDNHLSSVKNSCRLLKTFLDSEKELGVSELSRQLKLSKGAVHKLLMTLESEGFIKRNPVNKQYSLGYTLLELGNKVLRNHNITDFAKPYLHNLASTTQELVSLCVREDHDAIYVYKIDSPHPIRFNVETFQRFPLYASSASRVILAFQDNSLIKSVLGGHIQMYTPYSMNSPSEIEERLEAIRKNGYETSSNLKNEGVTGVAAPIYESNGAVNASISIVGPSDRVLPMRDKFIENVLSTTRDLSAQLGYRGH